MDAQTFQDTIGYCNVVSATSVEGWVFDRAVPDVPLVMEVLIDGNCIGSVTCNLVRENIVAAGHCPQQQVGFYVAVPADLQDDGDHVIEFRRSDGRPIALKDPTGIHQSWALPKATRAPRPAAPSSVILGCLDPVQEHGVYGWAYDQATPDVPVTLDIFIDSLFHASVVCDLERVDLVAAGHPTSKAGFRAEVPPRVLRRSAACPGGSFPARRSTAVRCGPGRK